MQKEKSSILKFYTKQTRVSKIKAKYRFFKQTKAERICHQLTCTTGRIKERPSVGRTVVPDGNLGFLKVMVLGTVSM